MNRAIVASIILHSTGRVEAELCSATPLAFPDLPRGCKRKRPTRAIKLRARQLPFCNKADFGQVCRGNGLCGTSAELNNCGRFDLYTRDLDSEEEEEWTNTEDERDAEEGEQDVEDDCDEDEEDVHEDEEDVHDDEEDVHDDEEDVHDDEEDVDEDEEDVDNDEEDVHDDEEDSDPPLAPSHRPTRQPTRLTSTLPPSTSGGDFKWPLYSQQCADDAGPPFADDLETFGPGRSYHDAGRASAVLTPSNQCSEPVRAACENRAQGGKITEAIARAAYLEGPLQCGGQGWFCRILPDRAHDLGIQRDWNFNHCNASDYGDTAGHCHGSDSDDTYYWWVRDHWHRNYAGRLHCCCGWGEASSMVGVVARCDYRAPLQPGENDECRDANEDHDGPGSGFSKGFDLGCPNLGQKTPLPEPDQGQCWDVLRFAPGGLDD